MFEVAYGHHHNTPVSVATWSTYYESEVYNLALNTTWAQGIAKVLRRDNDPNALQSVL